MRCPSCGQASPDQSLFCQQCGTRLTPGGGPGAAAAGPQCGHCGTANPSGMRFCTECGSRLEAEPQARSPSDRPAAGSGGPAPAAAHAAKIEAAVGGPICARCRGVGDPGASTCKFCGAPYDAAEPPAPQGGFGVTAPGPSETGRSEAPPPGVQAAPGTLTAILKDGSDGRVFPLAGDQTDVGREEGDVRLPDDPYLSARHARIRRRGDTFVLRDLDSVNGIYVRIHEPMELVHGDMILIGQQVLRFETLQDAELPLGPASVQGVLVFGTPEVPRVARLVQYTTEGVGRDVHYLYRDETVLGRETGDIVFTDDAFLSRRHASIVLDRANRRYMLRDMGSSNGSSLRLRDEHTLEPGDHFRVGRTLFRFDTASGSQGRP